MKHLYIDKLICLAALIAGIGAITGCDFDAKYDDFDTHAYIEESLSSSSQKITIPTDGEVSTTLNVHLSDLSSKDNVYRLVTDQTVLDAYNAANGTGYVMLPESNYQLPSTITVKAGQYASDALSVVFKPFTKDMMRSGESYALPLRLEAESGSLPAMNTTGSYIILAESIIEFSAPMFVGSSGMSAGKYNETPETYSEYTIEVRFQVENTGNRNRFLFNNGCDSDPGSGVLLRFEDPQSDNANFKAHSLVQVVGRNSIYLNPSNAFVPNKWQHIALVCDGSSYRLYINGVDSGVIGIPSGSTTFQNVSWFTGSYWGRCKILVSEARIWSVVRSASQIQNNMTSVSPKSEGLEAYWKLDEGEGNVFEDATGHGHTMTSSATPTWISGILSTDESTAWL